MSDDGFVLGVGMLAGQLGSVFFARTVQGLASLVGYRGLNGDGLAVLKDACANKPEAVALSQDFFAEAQTTPPGAAMTPGFGDSVPSSQTQGAASVGWAFAGQNNQAPSHHTVVFPQFPLLLNKKRSPVLGEEYVVRLNVPKQTANVSVWTRFRNFHGEHGMSVRQYLNIVRVKDQFNQFNVMPLETTTTLASILQFALCRSRNIVVESPGSIRWAGDPTVVSLVPPAPGMLYYLLNNIVPVLSNTDFNGIAQSLNAAPGRFHYLTVTPRYNKISPRSHLDIPMIYDAAVPAVVNVACTFGRFIAPGETITPAWVRVNFGLPIPRLRQTRNNFFFVESDVAPKAGVTVGRNLSSTISAAASTDYDLKTGPEFSIRLAHHPENESLPSTNLVLNSNAGVQARFNFNIGSVRAFVAGAFGDKNGSTKYGAGFSFDV